jgi:hypothetical protein
MPSDAQQRAKIASDDYAVEEAKREAAGLLPPNIGKPRIPHEPRHEAATDEQVYDRFKKRYVVVYSSSLLESSRSFRSSVGDEVSIALGRLTKG